MAYNMIKIQTTIATVPWRSCFHGTYNNSDGLFVSTIIIIAAHRYKRV